MRAFLTTPTRARHVVVVCGLMAALPVAVVATAGTPYATLARAAWVAVFFWTISFMLFPDSRGRITNLASLRGPKPSAPTKRWRNRIDPRTVDRGRFMDWQIRHTLRFGATLVFAACVAVVHAVMGLFG